MKGSQLPSAQSGVSPELPEAAGFSKRARVKISQIRTLSTERPGKRIGRATPELLDQLVEGLNEIVAG